MEDGVSTRGSSAYEDKPKQDGSGKRDIYFNAPGDGDRHGHVVERHDSGGRPQYHYVRDVEGNIFIDDAALRRKEALIGGAAQLRGATDFRSGHEQAQRLRREFKEAGWAGRGRD